MPESSRFAADLERDSRRRARKAASASIEAKIARLEVLGKKTLGEISGEEFEEHKRLTREVIDEMRQFLEMR